MAFPSVNLLIHLLFCPRLTLLPLPKCLRWAVAQVWLFFISFSSTSHLFISFSPPPQPHLFLQPFSSHLFSIPLSQLLFSTSKLLSCRLALFFFSRPLCPTFILSSSSLLISSSRAHAKAPEHCLNSCRSGTCSCKNSIEAVCFELCRVVTRGSQHGSENASGVSAGCAWWFVQVGMSG